MLRIFIGYDHRQPISYQVLHYSILKYASVPVAITPLVLPTLKLTRVGLTPFTYSRFMVPNLCDYKGWGLFLDADMVVLDDIKKLFDYADKKYKVMVCKNTKRFEWASVMLFNCEKCKEIDVEFIEKQEGLHAITWAKEEEIGSIDSCWNYLAGYDDYPLEEEPKLIHYTQGVPCFPETVATDYADVWFGLHKEMNSAKPWLTLMGNSVHCAEVNGVKVPKFFIDPKTKQPYERHKKALEEILRS